MHSTTETRLATRRTVRNGCAIVAPIALSAPTAAQALTMRELATEILDSPVSTFGLGVATGALLSGIVISVASTARQRKLEMQLREALETSLRNETAARTYQEMIRELRGREHRYREQLDHMHAEAEASRQAAEAVRQAAEANRQAAEGRRQMQEDSGTMRTVATILTERLHTEGPATQAAPATRSAAPVSDETVRMDDVMRADTIDHRIPRFDESLFPDVAGETRDDFAAAVSTLDTELEQTPGTVPPFMAASASTPAQQARPAEQPKVWEPREFDVKSYIDAIMEEELEETRGFDGRRFSRPPFTVWEGTGELNASRSKVVYKPRHLAHVVQEA